MGQVTLREFDRLCLPPVEPMPPEQIKRLREKSHVSQAVSAALLNRSVSAVQKWEIGQKRPIGTALKLTNSMQIGHELPTVQMSPDPRAHMAMDRQLHRALRTPKRCRRRMLVVHVDLPLGRVQLDSAHRPGTAQPQHNSLLSSLCVSSRSKRQGFNPKEFILPTHFWGGRFMECPLHFKVSESEVPIRRFVFTP